MREGRRLITSSPHRFTHLLIFLLFAALAALFLAPVLLGDRALLPTDFLMRMSPWAQERGAAVSPARPAQPWNPILWDAIAQFYPWRAFAAHWMRRGVIPFWDPHQFCGTPFLANSQSAVLYPLHLLLLDLPAGLPVARAMACLAAIHLTLAGFLTYLWLRVLRLSPFAAVLGGVTFMLSGFVVTWLELPSFLAVACWLPLLFLTFHRALEAPSLPRAAAAAAAVGLTLLGGHLQVAFYCLLGAGLYGGWGLGVRYSVFGVGCSDGSDGSDGSDRSDRTPNTQHPTPNTQHRTPNTQHPTPNTRPRAAAFLILALLLGGMLAAPQLLPAIELSHLSHRVSTASAAGYRAYVKGAMPASQLIRLFLPDFYGNPTHGDYIAGSPADYSEFGAYFGGVGLLLALVGLLAWRRRPRETLFSAGLACLALLMAAGTPLDALFYFGIPGFSQSGSPARILVLFCFAAAWLVGMGVQVLEEDGLQERLLTVARLPLIALAAWIVLLAAAMIPARAFVEAHGVDFSELLARSSPSLRRAALFAVLAAGLPVGLRQLSRAGSVSPVLSRLLARGVLAALLLGELWLFGAGFNPTGPLAEGYPSTPLIDALRSGLDSGVGRILPVNRHWSLLENPQALLPPNSALALGLLDAQGYDSLFIGRYKGFLDLVQEGDSAPRENGNMLFLSNLTSPLLPLLAADRIVVREAGRGSGSSGASPSAHRGDWPLLYSHADLEVRRYPAALPRAFIASASRPVTDEAAAADLRRLAANHGLGATALMAAWSPPGGAAGAMGVKLGGQGMRAGGDRVGLREVGPNEVMLTISRPRTGMLVLLDNAYPGWRATDGTGRTLAVQRVDLTFRGVELSGESQTVRLRYEPASFRLGLFLALLAIGAIAAALATGSIDRNSQG